MERLIERSLFASRWLMAPLFLGLAALLVLLVVQFGVAWVEFARNMLHAEEHDVIVGTLTLVDLVLVASLVMVMLSGYENFVSKIDAATAGERLSWLMKLDTGSIKVKVLSSIVAISAMTAVMLTLLDRIAAPGKH